MADYSFSTLNPDDDPQKKLMQQGLSLSGVPTSTPPPTSAQPSFAQDAAGMMGGAQPGGGMSPALSYGDMAGGMQTPSLWGDDDTSGMGGYGKPVMKMQPEQPGGGMTDPDFNTIKPGAGQAREDAYGQQNAAQPQDKALSFQSSLDALKGASDPQQMAVARDKLARDLYGSLSKSGHDVKWEGSDTLVIDGRPYQIAGAEGMAGAMGGGEAASSGQPAMGALASAMGATGTSATPSVAAAGGGPAAATAGGSASPAAAATRMTSVDPGLTGSLEQGRNYLQQQFSQAFNGRQLDEHQLNELVNRAGITGDTMTGAQMNHVLGLAEQLFGGQGTPTGPAPPSTPAAPTWTPSWGGYQPGALGTEDLEGFSFDELLRQLQPSGTDDAVDASIRRLLDNPHSMDDLTVDRMKAASKDELAEMADMQGDELRAFGSSMGIDDSNWMGARMADNAFNRDRAIVDSNRTVDMTAAQTRKADERAALQLGGGLANMSRQARQQAVSLAADTALKAAAQRGDRMALNESFRQKAAELGLSADEVSSRYSLGVMQDLTDRYGIDIGRDIDMRKLDQADSQFKQDLAFKMAQLQAQLEMFYTTENRLERTTGAEIGLSYSRLLNDVDNQARSRTGR